MPLLVLYQGDTGQIVSASRISHNHTAGNFPPKVQRLLEHAEELKLRHLFVDDCITPATHAVRKFSTGVGVVRREEADPHWLEPLLALAGDLRDAPTSGQPDLQVKYVVPAAANPEYISLRPGITVFVPVQARWYCGATFFEALARLKKPEGVDVGLVLYDNSSDPAFGALCRWFLASATGYTGTSYIRDTEPRPTGAGSVVKAVARIYGRMACLVDTEYVLTLEDDVVIMNDNVLVELYESLAHDSQAASSAANVVERTDRLTMCWHFLGDAPTLRYCKKVDRIQRVDGVSFSCTLWKTRLLKMHAFRPQRESEGSFFATDITLCVGLRDCGYHCLVHWDLHCAHVEPWYRIVPLREGPLQRRESCRPSSRKEVYESIGKFAGSPPTPKRSLADVVAGWFGPKAAPKVIERLVVLQVSKDSPKQFLMNLREVEFPEGTVLVVFGSANPDEWRELNVQFIDDWEVLCCVLQACERLLWWKSEVVVQPSDIVRILSGEGLIVADLPVGEPGGVPGFWACDREQLPKVLATYEDVAVSVSSRMAKIVSVECNRWIPGSGWASEEGYLPEGLSLERKLELTYYGDRAPTEEGDYSLDVSVGVTCLDRPDMTDEAIQSLLATTEYLKREIMVWDNASSDPRMEQVLLKYADHPIVQVFRSQVNRGYMYPMNFMSKRAKGEFFVVSNNDVVAHSGWFEALKEPFAVDPLVAQSGPPPEYGHLGDGMLGGPGEGDPDYLEGFFFMVPQWVLGRYPLFDEEHLSFATCEDADLSLRLREMGFKIEVCPDAKIDHLRSETRKDEQIGTKMDRVEEVNREYMVRRWNQYLRTHEFPQHRVLVRRRGANGDILACEGALKGLRWKYPHSHITFMTECVNIAADCPWVDDVRLSPERGVEYSKVYNLDYAYEEDLGQCRPRIVCKKAEVPYVRPGYWVTHKAWSAVEERFRGNRPMVAVHWHALWENRCWPIERWKELAWKLSKDYYLVEIGGAADERLGVGEQFYGKPWQEVAAVMRMCKVLVCADTVALHIGIGVQTKTVCLFGPTNPKFVADSQYLYPVKVDGLDCLGCHHAPPFPKDHSSCKQPQHYCMGGLSVCKVYKRVMEVLGRVGECEK